ncbi:VOC family protein [Synechococcus sp. BO 8801]|uniref:VOC family protein n=1 Tax=Synechococcus sp. BO 8801 TaxID=169670 RepID=UPI00336ABFDB
MIPHVRLARPVTDLRRTEVLYGEGLGLTRLDNFDNHDGFDGVMLGEPGGAYHFEFTYCRTHPVAPSPTPEDLLVFFIPDRQDWLRRCEAMQAAGWAHPGMGERRQRRRCRAHWRASVESPPVSPRRVCSFQPFDSWFPWAVWRWPWPCLRRPGPAAAKRASRRRGTPFPGRGSAPKSRSMR